MTDFSHLSAGEFLTFYLLQFDCCFAYFPSCYSALIIGSPVFLCPPVVPLSVPPSICSSRIQRGEERLSAILPCRPIQNGSSGGRDEEFHQSDTFNNHLPSKPPMPAGVRKWAAWGRSRRTPPPGTHFVALRGFSQTLLAALCLSPEGISL